MPREKRQVQLLKVLGTSVLQSPPPKPRLSKASRRRRGKYQFGWRSLRYYYYRLIRLRCTSTEIARGFAVGAFAACMPLFGLQVLISIAAATVFRGHRLVAVAATWISNPLTYIPLYAFEFHVGRSLLGYGELSFPKEAIGSIALLSELGADFLKALFLGCLVIGCGLSFCSYWASLYLVERARQRPRRRSRKHH